MEIEINTKIRVKLESFNYELLNLACKKINEIVESTESSQCRVISLPMKKRIYCVLRSPHVYKDSREHFEIRVHRSRLEIYYDTNIKMFDLIANIDLPSGVLSRIDLS